MWPFNKVEQPLPYTHIAYSCNELMKAVEFHECKKYPMQVEVHDTHPYIGFVCRACNQSWGIHEKNFNRFLDDMYFLMKRKFETLDARTKWAKEISEIVTAEMFYNKFKRNFLSYPGLLEAVMGNGLDMLREYEKLPVETQRQLCSFSFQHIKHFLDDAGITLFK